MVRAHRDGSRLSRWIRCADPRRVCGGLFGERDVMSQELLRWMEQQQQQLMVVCSV